MTTRTLIQDPPTKAALVDRSAMVTLRWLSWFDSITRASRATLTDATVDPPNLASGAAAQATVTVNGAKAGDLATASFSPANAGVMVVANVTADNTVTATFLNVSGGAIDLPSGTLRVRVEAWQ
ncbi:MAG: hypothetical protein KGR68_03755 [Betaproteobacteria bacterium]|nr:hypothetical protein [Betaproteobacteria bacterium]